MIWALRVRRRGQCEEDQILNLDLDLNVLSAGELREWIAGELSDLYDVANEDGAHMAVDTSRVHIFVNDQLVDSRSHIVWSDSPYITAEIREEDWQDLVQNMPPNVRAAIMELSRKPHDYSPDGTFSTTAEFGDFVDHFVSLFSIGRPSEDFLLDILRYCIQSPAASHQFGLIVSLATGQMSTLR